MYRAARSRFSQRRASQVRRRAPICGVARCRWHRTSPYNRTRLAQPSLDASILRTPGSDRLRLLHFWSEGVFNPHGRQASQQEPRAEVAPVNSPIKNGSRTRNTQRLQGFSQILIRPVKTKHVPLKHQAGLHLEILCRLRFRRLCRRGRRQRNGSSFLAHLVNLDFSASFDPRTIESILTHPYTRSPRLVLNIMEISDA